MPDSHGGTNGNWRNAVALALVKSGPTTILLAYMLWWMTHFAEAKVDHALTVLEEHAAAGQVLNDAQVRRNQREAAYELASLRIQVETCKAQANTSATARKCEDILTAWQYGQ